jgi:hypothetical protein
MCSTKAQATESVELTGPIPIKDCAIDANENIAGGSGENSFHHATQLTERVAAGLEHAVFGLNRSWDSRISCALIQLVGWAELSRNAEAVFAKLARSRD